MEYYSTGQARLSGTAPLPWLSPYFLQNAIGLQKGVLVVWQLITGVEGDMPIACILRPLDEEIGILLCALAYYEGWEELVHRVETCPNPDIPIFAKDLFDWRKVLLFFLTNDHSSSSWASVRWRFFIR